MMWWKYKDLSREELIKIIEEQSHKIRCFAGEKGSYKAKVTKEVKEREQRIKDKEELIASKIKFLEENNYESLKEEKKQNLKLRDEAERLDEENRKQLEILFNNSKEEIIKQLSDELIRWTEEFDISTEKSQGYLIGINKAKKIIKENLKFKLDNKSIAIKRILGE